MKIDELKKLLENPSFLDKVAIIAAFEELQSNEITEKEENEKLQAENERLQEENKKLFLQVPTKKDITEDETIEEIDESNKTLDDIVKELETNGREENNN